MPDELLYALHSIVVLRVEFFFSVYTLHIVLWTMAGGSGSVAWTKDKSIVMCKCVCMMPALLLAYKDNRKEPSHQ